MENTIKATTDKNKKSIFSFLRVEKPKTTTTNKKGKVTTEINKSVEILRIFKSENDTQNFKLLQLIARKLKKKYSTDLLIEKYVSMFETSDLIKELTFTTEEIESIKDKEPETTQTEPLKQ